jgi:drug/metabolite transporter (DMT)-like permease
MNLWVAFTIFAALMQTLRFVLQKSLSADARPGIAGPGPAGRATLSTVGATFARFLFAAPLALLGAVAALAATGHAPPPLGLRFWLCIAVGGVAQIVATDLTVRLFAQRNFAVGVAFTKTETAQVALFSAVLLGEVVSLWGGMGIGVGLVGVLCLLRGIGPGGGMAWRPVLTGLAAGALFGLASVGFRAATLTLDPAPFLLRALVALAAATTLQTLVMAAWLAWREPGQIGRVTAGWRRTMPVGITGLAGSLGWFAAFSLQNAAYVRAVGQIEMVFTLFASVFVFRERLAPRESVGVALVVLSVVLLVLSAR